MDAAEAVLAKPASTLDNTRIFTLAEALFQSIGMQLSVEKYKAIAVDRGASLDTLDYPLNDRFWLLERFAGIRKLPGEPERLAALEEILQWTDPGPGGFYDDLGDPARQPHLVPNTVSFADSPDFRKSVFTSFDYKMDRPREWWTNVLSMYDAPVQMHYDGLDKKAKYSIRVVY